jgi:hypothetical protein
MRWQPFYGFKTGLNQQQWDALSTDEQREALRGSGNRSKEPVEITDEPELLTERLAFPVRVVSKIDLDRMPLFELYL